MPSDSGNMHIGWDLDDTTTNLTEELLQIYDRRYHTNARIEEVKDWSFFPKEVHEEMKSSGYRNLKLIGAAKEILSKLKEKGDKVSIITYRALDYEDDTKDWLERNIPGLYDGVYLTGGPKLEVCRRLGIQLLVDDSKMEILDISNKLGIHTILLRTSMNRDVRSSELIRVAESLPDIFEWIEKLRPHIVALKSL